MSHKMKHHWSQPAVAIDISFRRFSRPTPGPGSQAFQILESLVDDTVSSHRSILFQYRSTINRRDTHRPLQVVDLLIWKSIASLAPAYRIDDRFL